MVAGSPAPKAGRRVWFSSSFLLAPRLNSLRYSLFLILFDMGAKEVSGNTHGGGFLSGLGRHV
jgi:hypothetical protein